MGSGLVGAYRLRWAFFGGSGGSGFELGGVAAAAAVAVVIIQMSPEINGSAVHAPATAQRDRTAAAGAVGLRLQRQSACAGVSATAMMGWWVSGWWAVFIRCGSFARSNGTSETAVLSFTLPADRMGGSRAVDQR